MEFAMTDATLRHHVERASTGAYAFRVLARIARAIDRMLFAHRIRHDLTELPNRLRRDIGLMTTCPQACNAAAKDFLKTLRGA
jgi:uncharacterized protein YjiS (DUF1127 family)